MQTKRNFIFLVAFSSAAFAANSSLEQCNKLASAMNKQFPMAIDKITIIENTLCIPSNGAVALRYHYTIKVPSNSVTQSDLTLKLREQQLAGWCTSPDQRYLINLFNIEYLYKDQTGAYIGILRYDKSMCKK